MEEIQYIGEHLWPGQIGHAGIILGFLAAVLSAVAYFFGTQRRALPEANNWNRIGRYSFIIHGLCTFAVIGLIFFVMINKYYEYSYVQQHVSEELPMQYIFSAFWEGQEGSFLLWMFWHVILGFVLIWKSKSWEAPVVAVLALVQVFLASMLLGIYVGFGEHAMKIGSNPMLLLRDTMNLPLFTKENYVELIKGTGLNPLLQNYWMTIHPPTLFLGFASTTIPFAFAVAGLWTGRHKEWLKPAITWALFSGAILGTGILMGGAWAYEALSFGGYWAWDPVENMSLVPWLILLAGIHTNLIAKTTGHSIRATYIYYLLTFILIVYSTFLTRSGVLGETSVHAFTEMGLEWQLILFIGTFTLLSIIPLVVKYKEIPAPKKEESITSKEFWMFLGTLTLLLSAILITASTSLPVFNKIMEYFNPDFEGRVITNPVDHYNRTQLWIGVLIGLLSGGAQLLRFKEFNWKKYAPKYALHIGVSVAIAAGLTALTAAWVSIYTWQYGLLLFTGLFTVVANLDYLITFIRGNLKAAGSVFSHVGFGVMVLGIIASGLNQNVISSNPFVMDGLIDGEEESHRTNILLFKNIPMTMDNYEVTYVNDTLDILTRTYTVNYKRKDEAGQVLEEFDLNPNVLYDKTFTKIAASNPSTKHYFERDVFTHITSLPRVEMDFEFKRKQEDSLNYRRLDIALGSPFQFVDTVKLDKRGPDSILLRTITVIPDKIIRNPVREEYHPEPGDLPLGVQFRISRSDVDSVFEANSMVVLRDQSVLMFPAQINEISARLRLHQDVYRQLITLESQLDYKEFSLKQGEQFTYNGIQIEFAGFNRTPQNPGYQQKEGDIAVSAMLRIQQDNQTAVAEPVYVVRDRRIRDVKAFVEEFGLHFRFVELNPEHETMKLLLAEEPEKGSIVPVEVATDAYRSDYIVLKAIEFPGINYFWLGSILMMLGLTISMGNRMSQKS